MRRMRLEAEVIGRFDGAGDCDKLLYAPLGRKLRFRHSRVYQLDFDGDAEAVERFVRRVLVDRVSQDLHLGGEPGLQGWLFHLDYGMKPGALDLEKEAVCRYHGELSDPGFEMRSLAISQRIYVFGDDPADEVPIDRFVRDIVNPAIHIWNVHHHEPRSRSRA